MKLFNHNSTMFMVICMFFAGFASTMNMWVDKLSDIRFSMNDVYMVGLMKGWMIFFMGLWYSYTKGAIYGGIIVLVFYFAIRYQVFVSEKDYLNGMIPHHSMAIHMSKRLKEKENSIQPLLDSIINGQEQEIEFMKQRLASKS